LVPLIPPRALVQPFGMTIQWMLNDEGKRVPKHCLLQDLSFSLSKENASVISWVDMDKNNKMLYGWCLSHIIHYVVAPKNAYLLPSTITATPTIQCRLGCGTVHSDI
jgi:hypothetical protein